jgi:hypothetical protein
LTVQALSGSAPAGRQQIRRRRNRRRRRRRRRRPGREAGVRAKEEERAWQWH